MMEGRVGDVGFGRLRDVVGELEEEVMRGDLWMVDKGEVG